MPVRRTRRVKSSTSGVEDPFRQSFHVTSRAVSRPEQPQSEIVAQPEPVRQPTRSEVAESAPLYRIAYEASQRSLDDQLDELNRLRDRAVQFVAFVGAATAFLAGTGLLHPTHRDGSYYGLAIAGSVLSLIMIGLLFSLLIPRSRALLRSGKDQMWRNRVSARLLIADWIEPQVPHMSEGDLLRALARQYDDYRASNEDFLGALRRSYRWLIVIGSAQVTVWAALVWAKG